MKETNKKDPEISNLIEKELIRQKEVLNLIPSENYASPAVLEATGSVLANKYSEGYPFKRYYQGNANADEIEKLAIDRAKMLFNAEHVNVQPLSGSPANFAVFLAFLQPGDKFMGLDLSCGGHLTHGSPVNFSGKIYHSIPYPVNKQTHLLDMQEIRQIALRERPKLIISGLTAYPRNIDYKAFQDIAEEVNAIHLADISHIAGLIATKSIPSPFPFTDIVMLTTHKTLRGPRGASLLCKEKFAKDLDRAVFPGSQGGPHDNTTAAKAICFKEALQPEFKQYSEQIIRNAKELANTLMNNSIKLITNGTDNHLILIDLLPYGIGMGRQIATALENANICLNANSIPFDHSTPFKPSGIRLGTPILTTRGMKEPEMQQIGKWIADIIKDYENIELQEQIKLKVKELCSKFPVYEGL
jgi:glycine hydroxymethyltransferase